jgi:hypothetical protein
MRGRAAAALLVSAALAQAGCGGLAPGAADYSCGHVGRSATALRDQARSLADRERSRPTRLSSEEAVLDAEFQLEHACRGAADADRGYRRAGARRSAGWFSPVSR